MFTKKKKERERGAYFPPFSYYYLLFLSYNYLVALSRASRWQSIPYYDDYEITARPNSHSLGSRLDTNRRGLTCHVFCSFTYRFGP